MPTEGKAVERKRNGEVPKRQVSSGYGIPSSQNTLLLRQVFASQVIQKIRHQEHSAHVNLSSLQSGYTYTKFSSRWCWKCVTLSHTPLTLHCHLVQRLSWIDEFAQEQLYIKAEEYTLNLPVWKTNRTATFFSEQLCLKLPLANSDTKFFLTIKLKGITQVYND